MMHETLNPDFEIIYHKEQTGEIFIRNKFYGNLLSLNQIEYEIIKYYIDHPNLLSVVNHYSSEYDIDEAFATQLIHKARHLNLILTTEYLSKKSADLKKEDSQIVSYTKYLFSKAEKIFNLIGIKIYPEFKGSFRFYKFFSIRLKNTYLEKFAIHKRLQQSSLFLFYLVMAVSIVGLFFQNYNSISIQRISQLNPPEAYLIFIVIFMVVIVSTFIHEFAHFLMYKRYGGKTSEMGFALMAGILPIIYTSTNSLVFWDSRKNKIIVVAAGIMADLVLLAITIHAFLMFSADFVQYFSIVFVFIFAIRILTNINPFIPGTDGYYIASELLKNKFPGSSAKEYKIILSQIAKFQFNHIRKKDIFRLTYFFLSVISISISYALLLATVYIIYSKGF